MSNNSIQKAKNKVGNTISDAKNPIRGIKEEILEKIGSFKTFCQFPSRKINFSIKWVDAIDAVRMLLEILAGLIGKKLSELKVDLSKFLSTKVFSLSKNIKFDLSKYLKECFACKINPIIPDWLIDDGINIEIDQIDNKGMFKINPDSRVGSLLYGGSDDMNRFLFNVIQSSTPLNWPNNSNPIASFEFIETGANVGYDKTLETNGVGNKGKQNTDLQNNVINMKIDKKYQTKTIIDFMNDYLNSQDNIFDPKLVISQTLDIDYGITSRMANFDLPTLRKQVELETTVEELYKCGFDNPNIILDNSFFNFSREQLEYIDEKIENKKTGVIQLNKCCCGADSTIDTSTIVNLTDRLKKSTKTEDQINIINNALDQMATISTNNVNETDKEKGFWEFITNLTGNLSTTLTMMILSPKLNFLIISLYYMLNGKARFDSIREYFSQIQCVLRELLQKILKTLIYEFLLPKVLKAMSIILKCYLKKLIAKKLEEHKLAIKSWTPSIPQSIMNEIRSIMGTPQEILNGVVDAGVDAAENFGQQAIESRKEKNT